MTTPLRILVADDEPLVRSGIDMLVSAEPGIDVIGEAADGAQAVLLARQLRPDVVLMDVRMPGMDGVEATRQITADTFAPAGPFVTVLVLSTYNHDDSVYAALRAGASGFLLKDAARSELIRAVRAVAAGDGWLDPAVTKGLLTEFAARPQPQRPTPAELTQLTPREHDVLLLVAHGLSNPEIAGRLFIGEATVKTHLGRIYTKLDLRDRAQAVVAAYRAGLITPEPSPVPPGRRL
ncbi:LuxR family two component transcriptional regulator [Krasilnikovia cinnamomea]|uniref:LuxR family two component transcriptional regulator n=1 Tax=Krasilnikovia cinnamomea TaxID=349313 RepID=A0A4Q7ZUN8_9ACTN|nr:response regulator transcription factor [Krasilnikovia cinnamomea]RZU54299.1 LuxR family two component transcriptional regulator [Krasilnikovia cinnamomea]